MPKEEEEIRPLNEVEGNCYWLFRCPMAPTPALKEGGSEFGDEDYDLLSTDVLEAELTKEEVLALAHKAPMDSTMKERAARTASLLFDDVPGTFTLSRTSFFIYHVNVIFVLCLYGFSDVGPALRESCGPLWRLLRRWQSLLLLHLW